MRSLSPFSPSYRVSRLCSAIAACAMTTLVVTASPAMSQIAGSDLSRAETEPRHARVKAPPRPIATNVTPGEPDTEVKKHVHRAGISKRGAASRRHLVQPSN